MLIIDGILRLNIFCIIFIDEHLAGWVCGSCRLGLQKCMWKQHYKRTENTWINCIAPVFCVVKSSESSTKWLRWQIICDILHMFLHFLLLWRKTFVFFTWGSLVYGKLYFYISTKESQVCCDTGHCACKRLLLYRLKAHSSMKSELLHSPPATAQPRIILPAVNRYRYNKTDEESNRSNQPFRHHCL